MRTRPRSRYGCLQNTLRVRDLEYSCGLVAAGVAEELRPVRGTTRRVRVSLDSGVHLTILKKVNTNGSKRA